MPIVYDSPIGPTQNGAPLPANRISGGLLDQAIDGATKLAGAGVPIPSLTGGSAGPSGANAEGSPVFVNAVSGSAGVILPILIFVGFALWIRKKMK